MDFLSLAKKRYSCRNYLAKNPPEELLIEVLEAARVAPSAKNLQPWHFVIITDPPLLKEIKSCYGREWIQSAPAIIIACGNHIESWKRDDGKDHCDIDVSIAIDHITLAATEKELGTCWICKFDAIRTAEILDLPSYWEPVALIPIGYPDGSPDPDRHDTLRKKIDKITSLNEFVEPDMDNGNH